MAKLSRKETEEAFALVTMFDGLLSEIEEMDNWDDLAESMHAVLKAVIESDGESARVIRGLILSMFLVALGKGGNTDADVIGARMAMDWKYRVREGLEKDLLKNNG